MEKKKSPSRPLFLLHPPAPAPQEVTLPEMVISVPAPARAAAPRLLAPASDARPSPEALARARAWASRGDLETARAMARTLPKDDGAPDPYRAAYEPKTFARDKQELDTKASPDFRDFATARHMARTIPNDALPGTGPVYVPSEHTGVKYLQDTTMDPDGRDLSVAKHMVKKHLPQEAAETEIAAKDGKVVPDGPPVDPRAAAEAARWADAQTAQYDARSAAMAQAAREKADLDQARKMAASIPQPADDHAFKSLLAMYK
jgi:hypothetical protein